MIERIRRLLQWTGYDVVRHPRPCTVEKYVREVFTRHEVNCVFDVGANTGQYARLLRRIGYTGWILSFEPIPSVVATLREHAARDARWRVFPVALGDRDGKALLHVAERMDFSSILDTSPYGRATFPNSTEVITEERVEIKRLDGLYEHVTEDLGAVRPFLKSDTQGYDLNVLRGARGCLDQFVGLQLELPIKPVYEGMPDAAEVLAAIQTRGFEVVGFSPVGVDRRGALIEVDCVAQRVAGELEQAHG